MSSRWTTRISGGGGGGGGGTLAGDVTGPLLTNTVVGIQTTPVSAAAPIGGDVLTFDGASWAPAAPAGGMQLVSAAGAFAVPAGVAVNDLVYVTGAFAADQADNTAIGTTPAMGVVIAKPTAVTATLAYMGQVGGFAGLTAGSVYYLGTLGGITTTAPSTPGNVIQRVGVALSGTVFLFSAGALVDVVV